MDKTPAHFHFFSMANLNKNEEIGLLSENAEVFRSKLISDFHLLGSISVEDSGVKVESPCYYTDDVTGMYVQSI